MSILRPGRRGFLAGVSALLAVPALVRDSGVLMPVKSWVPQPEPQTQYGRFVTAADNRKVLGVGGDCELVVRIPSDLPVGMAVTFYATGKGVVRFQPEAGVQLVSFGSFETRKQFSMVQLENFGENAWGMMGDTA